jgi:hypothetical protein
MSSFLNNTTLSRLRLRKLVGVCVSFLIVMTYVGRSPLGCPACFFLVAGLFIT